MNKGILTYFFILLLAAGVSFSVQAQSNLSDVQRGVAEFSDGLAKALPFSSSLGLNWSDAYIGKFFPSAPPHFGVGVAVGATSLETDSLRNLASQMGAVIFGNSRWIPIPAYTLEGRMGGFFLPFDVGIKFGYLPTLRYQEIDLDYMLVGGDVRYAVLDGKRNPLVPNVSVGLGLNYISGGVRTNVGLSQSIRIGIFNFHFSNSDVSFKWDSLSLDFKVQISKSLLFLTPYVGLGGSYAWSKAGYLIETGVTVNGQAITQNHIDAINAELDKLNLERIDISAQGFSSIVRRNDINLRAFGGLSFNLMVLKLDLTGLYSFLDNNFGASLGFRFQI